MFTRLSLLAVSTLLLAACDGNPLQTAARKTACCCDRCPTAAAPAAAPVAVPPGPRPARAVATGERARTYRARTAETAAGRSRYARYESSETERSVGGYGGRYGARGGVSVTASDTGTASSRYSYSESSSGYGYGAAGGVYGYGAGGGQAPYGGHHGARTDADGYLTWPGKVED